MLSCPSTDRGVHQEGAKVRAWVAKESSGISLATWASVAQGPSFRGCLGRGHSWYLEL